MKTIYILPSKYMLLIAKEDMEHPSKRALQNHRIFHTQDITKEIIEQTFKMSKAKVLAFNSKDDAFFAMRCSLVPNNTAPDFIDGDIPFFAVPVIFTVEVEDNFDLGKNEVLTGKMLRSFFETDSIPFFSAQFKKVKDKIIDDEIKKLPSSPPVFHVDKARLPELVQTYYLAANPLREACVNLKTAQQDLEKIKEQEAKPIAPACVLF